MNDYRKWLIKEGKEPGLVFDKQGGVVPQNIASAKEYDLITLPVVGTNCFNCEYIVGEGPVRFCRHEKIQQYVNKHNCCALWNHDDVHRPWKK